MGELYNNVERSRNKMKEIHETRPGFCWAGHAATEEPADL